MLKRFSIVFAILSFFLLLTLESCSDTKNHIDLEAIQLKLEIKRFEKDLFQGDIEKENLKKLNAEYPFFFDFFCSEVIPLKATDTSEFIRNLNHFSSDSSVRRTYEDVLKNFEDFSAEKQSLTNAFKRYKFYFPEKIIPQFFTMVSAFNYGIMVFDSLIVVGLDMYLGQEYPMYSQLQFPKYKRAKMVKSQLSQDVLFGWVSTEFEAPERGSTFLENIIYQGKLLYAMSVLFPEAVDSSLMNFSLNQMQWCSDNELSIWAFFVKEELLYSKDYGHINRFINEAPFTSTFGQESAPRTGTYIGWQIVKNYMKNDISLNELMHEKDAVKILTKSKYKPQKK